MIIELPRKIKVDTDNIRPDLAEVVKEEYTYQDKLLFIDLMVQRLHHADSGTKVNRLIKQTFAYRLDEYGEFADETEFLSTEFMKDCYQLGQEDHKLYSRNFTGDYNTDEAIMRIEAIVIKAVMEYERRQDE